MLEQEIYKLENENLKIKESIRKIEAGEFLTRPRFYDIETADTNLTVDALIAELKEIKSKSFYIGQYIEVDDNSIGFYYNEVIETKEQAAERSVRLQTMLDCNLSKISAMRKVDKFVAGKINC